jgi:uncharacterized delta-60 repeat protein
MKNLTKALLLAMAILAAASHAQSINSYQEERGFFPNGADSLSGLGQPNPLGSDYYSLDKLDRDAPLRGFSAERSPFSKHLRRFHEERALLSAPSAARGGLHSASGVEEAWVRHYAGPGFAGPDLITGIATDASGNVYVTGHSFGLPYGVDFLTMKYTAAGAKVWEARYNGPGNGDDLPAAIAVDPASGEVYVTGVSAGMGTLDDYVTVKYNNAGVEQWAARYNGPANSFDEATAMTIDANGNVFVTGRSVGAGTFEDFATIKYNNAGAEQWVARYNGVGTPYDVATAIALDANGNVCVTGWSRETAGSKYATIKYNGAGVEQWIALYSGPSSGNDYTTDLAVDANGNVYVTGASVGSNSSFDYGTVKYNSAGVQQWVARYNGPANSRDLANALAVDPVSEEVYVTGASQGIGSAYDYATIKYNNAGVEQWVARHNGPGNSDDQASALALDPASGDVYVTGESVSSGSDYATIKYNSAGVQQWEARYLRPGDFLEKPPVLALSPAGNIFVAGQTLGASGSLDFLTISHDNFGSVQWAVTYNGPHQRSSDEAVALAVDATGNVYVTGWSTTTNSSTDYLTVKYDAAGVVQWTARYDAGNNLDEPAAIAVDAGGNVYVTGRSRLPGFNTSDYLTIKYNSAGSVLWLARYNRPGNNSDVPSALHVDPLNGDVYVTGSSRATGPDYDYATVKYNSAGAEQWVAFYNGPADSTDLATALEVDAAGNVYVTGQSRGLGTANDYATVKYNSAGVQQWVSRYNGPGNLDDIAAALDLDAAGNVHVTGQSRGAGTDDDYATIKYDAAGVQQWLARYNGPANSIDEAAALAVDAAGNVYVTGTSIGSTTSFDYATIKYNAAGVQQWNARYNGPSNSFDFAHTLALDAEGNVYVTGSVGYRKAVSPGVFAIITDYGTLKYNGAGVEQWAAFFNGPANDVDDPAALAVDANGNVYVTGVTFAWSKNTWWRIYSTVKYSLLPPGAPALLAPNDGAANQPVTLALNWSVSPEASSYRLQVSTTSDFAATVVDDSLLTTTSRQVGPLENDATYYWRVRAKNLAGVSPWSNVWSFTTAPPCFSNGDVNNDGALTPGDALCAFQIYLNNGALPPSCDTPNFECELIAADVNCDSAATPGDALAIFQRYLQNLPPEDCFGSSLLAKAEVQKRAHQLSLRQQRLAPQEEFGEQEIVKLALLVDNPAGLNAFGLRLHYPSDKLELLKVQRANLTAEWMQLEGRALSPGEIIIGGFHEQPIANAARGELFEVLFIAKGQTRETDFTLSHLSDAFASQALSAGNAEQAQLAGIPQEYELAQNHPNPFNPTTLIHYGLPRASEVKLVIFDVQGRAVRTLVNQSQQAGRYAITWDGRNERGEQVGSGVYLYQLRAGEFVQARRMALVR